MTPDHALELRGRHASATAGSRCGTCRSRCRAGTSCGLIGPNGAGKTTIIKLIMNLVRRDAGEIRVFGLDNRARRRGREVADRLRVRRRPATGTTARSTTQRRVLGPFYPAWNDQTFDRLAAEFELPMRQEVRDAVARHEDEVRARDGALARRRPADPRRADGGPRPGVPARAAPAALGRCCRTRASRCCTRRTSRATSSGSRTSSRSSTRGEVVFSMPRDGAARHLGDRARRRTGVARPGAGDRARAACRALRHRGPGVGCPRGGAHRRRRRRCRPAFARGHHGAHGRGVRSCFVGCSSRTFA